jgi:hypothetical protein
MAALLGFLIWSERAVRLPALVDARAVPADVVAHDDEDAGVLRRLRACSERKKECGERNEKERATASHEALLSRFDPRFSASAASRGKPVEFRLAFL